MEYHPTCYRAKSNRDDDTRILIVRQTFIHHLSKRSKFANPALMTAMLMLTTNRDDDTRILIVHQVLSTICHNGAPLKCSNCLQLNGAQSNKYSWRCKKPIFDGWARLLSSTHKYPKVLTNAHKLSFICKKHNCDGLAYARKSFCQGWLESWRAQTEVQV